MLPYTICASYTGILSAARNRPEHRPRKGRGEPPEAASASSHTLSFLHHSIPGNLATGSQNAIIAGHARHEGSVPLGTRKRVGGAHGAMDSGAVTRPVLGNLAAGSRSECEYRYGDESADDGGSDQTMPARPPPTGIPRCTHLMLAPPRSWAGARSLPSLWLYQWE